MTSSFLLTPDAYSLPAPAGESRTMYHRGWNLLLLPEKEACASSQPFSKPLSSLMLVSRLCVYSSVLSPAGPSLQLHMWARDGAVLGAQGPETVLKKAESTKKQKRGERNGRGRHRIYQKSFLFPAAHVSPIRSIWQPPQQRPSSSTGRRVSTRQQPRASPSRPCSWATRLLQP